jgi:hypothetical protein
MKISYLLVTLVFICVVNFAVKAQEFIAPQLEFTCELRVTIDPPLDLGNTARGERIIIPIKGGTFEGPKLKGVVLSGGADYQYSDKKNDRTEIEAIYTIKTDDNVLIHIRNVGLIYTSPEVKNNANFDFSKVYFRAAPKFEAPSNSKYDWLNNAIFICKAVPTKDYVSIQVWKVL